MKTNTLSLLFIPFLSYFSLSQTAQARNPEIDRLRDEVIALNAKLITDLTEAVTSIGNDVELVHASIIAVRPETVDTAAAYSQAKSLIADLDVLRRHAIADLTLLSDYTPPDVPPPTALAGTSTDPESALASTYQDLASVQHSFVHIEAETLSVQKSLERLIADGETFSISKMFEIQFLMSELSQCTLTSTAIVSAVNAAILGMTRNFKG
jgi:hypothetical protein